MRAPVEPNVRRERVRIGQLGGVAVEKRRQDQERGTRRRAAIWPAGFPCGVTEDGRGGRPQPHRFELAGPQVGEGLWLVEVESVDLRQRTLALLRMRGKQ